MKFELEFTDTFGGDANYSWVQRHTLHAGESISDRALVAMAKKEIGLTGVKCRRELWGETIALYPIGSCTVLFIIPSH